MTYDWLYTGEPSVVREQPVTTGLALAGFLYDDIGNRLQINRGNNSGTNLSYDPVSRLSTLTQNLLGTAQDITLGFTYAPSSQLATNSRDNGAYSWTGSSGTPLTYTNDGLNRLTGVAGFGVASALGYDGRGNVTNAGTPTYGYALENMKPF